MVELQLLQRFRLQQKTARAGLTCWARSSSLTTSVYFGTFAKRLSLRGIATEQSTAWESTRCSFTATAFLIYGLSQTARNMSWSQSPKDVQVPAQRIDVAQHSWPSKRMGPPASMMAATIAHDILAIRSQDRISTTKIGKLERLKAVAQEGHHVEEAIYYLHELKRQLEAETKWDTSKGLETQRHTSTNVRH